jgi:hypothetical protein
MNIAKSFVRFSLEGGLVNSSRDGSAGDRQWRRKIFKLCLFYTIQRHHHQRALRVIATSLAFYGSMMFQARVNVKMFLKLAGFWEPNCVKAEHRRLDKHTWPVWSGADVQLPRHPDRL